MTTAEWVRRITETRYLDGVDGPTWSGQPVLARFIVTVDRTDCALCHRPLTKQQRRARQTHCSYACDARARTGVRRARRAS